MRTDGYVYLLKADGGFYKIGKTKEPGGRFGDYRNSPFNVQHVHSIYSDSPFWLEKTLHKTFRGCHVVGEWFKLTDDEVAALIQIKTVKRNDPACCLPENIAGRVVVLRIDQTPGYHDIVTQIPNGLWESLNAEAERKGGSATSVLISILRLRYGKAATAKQMARPIRRGRSRKEN